MYAIFDIDNTVADDSWRLEFIRHDTSDNVKKYKAYHEASWLDAVGNQDVVERHVFQGHKIIFVTARPEYHRTTTESWLIQAGFKFEKLFMRQTSQEGISSPDLKKMILESSGIDFKHIAICYDDRADVVGMYKSLGLNAQQLYINKQNEHWETIK